MVKFSRFIGTVLVIIWSTAAMSLADDSEVVEWVGSQLEPISRIEPSTNTKDLAWLGEAIGDASIVAAGEATHGTREFFQLKHRLFQYLVQHKEFRVFALEAPFAKAFAINEYVKTGEGDPEQLVHDMGFWPWDTEEVVELVRWMRDYNATHDEKLTFVGFDTQSSSSSLLHVLAYMEGLNDSRSMELTKPFELFRKLLTGEQFENRSELVKQVNSPESLIAFTRHATDIYLFLSQNRDLLTEQTSPSEFRKAHGAALAAAWGLRMAYPDTWRFTGSDTVRSVRDHGMADMIKWMQGNVSENGKIYIWAHNAHVAKTRQKDIDITMGMILGEKHGDDYFNIGFVFNQGGFQALDPKATGQQKGKLVEFLVSGATEGYVGHLLAKTNVASFFLDLRKLPRGSEADHWFNVPRMLRWTGAVYSDELEAKHPPRHLTKSYDSLIFVDTTSRARPTQLSDRK